jgi:hypothetical protein
MSEQARFCKRCGTQDSQSASTPSQPLPSTPTIHENSNYISQASQFAPAQENSNSYPVSEQPMIYTRHEEYKTISTALPILGLFTNYISSLFAHYYVDKGLIEMETVVYGQPQGKNTTIKGVALLSTGLLGALLTPIVISINNQSDYSLILPFIASTCIIGLAVWVWLSSCKQRDRLFRLASDVGIYVVDKRGYDLPVIGCFGTWLFWLIIILIKINLVVILGPSVRQYRTVSMYNEIALAFNRHQQR